MLFRTIWLLQTFYESGLQLVSKKAKNHHTGLALVEKVELPESKSSYFIRNGVFLKLRWCFLKPHLAEE